jgi:plastocyanin
MQTVTNLTRLRGPLTLALCLSSAFALASCSQPAGTPSAALTTAPSTAPSTAPTTASSTQSAPAAPTTAAGRRIDITVKGKQVTPAPATVNIAVGESLTIAVTSDHDDQLHAHGFDVEKNIKAGEPAEVTIKGAAQGVYEFELHHPELRLFQVAVR